MNRPQPPDALRRWLAAEEAAAAAAPGIAAPAGSATPASWSDETFPSSPALEIDAHDLADAALAELFAGQPLAAPPAGFADRVLARAFTPEAVAAPLVARRRPRAAWRLMPALGLAAAAALLAAPLWLPLLLHGLRALVSASTISMALQGAIGAVEGFAQLVAVLVSWANTLFLLAMAVARPLTVPPVAALVALSLAISVLSLRSLHALIQRDRRWVYVDPI